MFVAGNECKGDKVGVEYGCFETVLEEDNPESSVGAALCRESEELEKAQGMS